MRRTLAALWLISLVSDVAAADYGAPEFELPALRGSTPYVPAPPIYHRWSGFYGGGQFGYANGKTDFGSSPSSVISQILRFTALEDQFHPGRWTSIPSAYPSGANFGAFVGYNSQWDDLVLGLELNYTHGTLTGSGSDAIARRVTLNDFLYDVTVTSSAAMKLHDYFNSRIRAGYVMGQFLPYFSAGFVVGVLDYSKSGSVGYPTPIYALPPPIPPAGPPPTPPAVPTETLSDGKKNAVALGYSVGGGVDVEVMPNVFVRGEYEFVGLPVARMKLFMHNFRLAAGLKM